MAKYGERKRKLNFIGEGSVAKVIVNLSLDKGFDYLVPDSLRATVRPGSQVRVPFGHSERSGYVLSIGNSSVYGKNELKSILGMRDDAPKVNESLLKLAEWMAAARSREKRQAEKKESRGILFGKKRRRGSKVHFR